MSFRLYTPRRLLSTSSPSPADFTHIIIGAGVIGLSIARHLQSLPSTKVLLLERHPSPGNETSSRNSEVIHAGIYYPPSSLKSKLCVRGKELLYSYCERRRIPYRRCGKWVVAQTEREVEALEEIAARAGAVGVPTRFLSKGEVAAEPAVRAHAVLESRTTGIVDSHAFMLALQGEFEEKGGLGAWNSMVTGVEPAGRGWRVATPDGEVTGRWVINAAGLGACQVDNMAFAPSSSAGTQTEGVDGGRVTLPPKAASRKPVYVKGTYYTLTSSIQNPPKRLIYPAPLSNLVGLGTHLTIDLAGRIKFGPDVLRVEDPENYAPADQAKEALEQIERYLPQVKGMELVPEYCGIRPKVEGLTDFEVERRGDNWVSCLGIESPGLTASLAIAERVGELVG